MAFRTRNHTKKLGLLLLSTCAAQVAIANEPSSIFELSLAELLELKIDVSGKAVQDLALDRHALTQNPAAIKNFLEASSIDIVSRETIEARGLRNVVDVVQNMPGITVGESPSEPYSFGMRGFDRSEVNVLYDGISMGISNLNMRPIGTSYIQQVEAHKGPVLLGGEGSAGGTINIIPRKAKQTPYHFQSANLTYGSFETQQLITDFYGPLGEQSSYLLNLDYRKSGGWVDNSESMSSSMNASVSRKYNEDLELIVSLDYFEDELPGYWGTPFVPESIATAPSNVARSGDFVIDESLRETNYNVSDQIIDSKSHWARAELNWQINQSSFLKNKLYSHSAKRQWQNAENYVYQESNQTILRDRFLVTHDRDILGLISDFNFAWYTGKIENNSTLSVEYSQNNFYRMVGFEPVDVFVDEVDLRNPEAGMFNATSIEIRPDYYDETRTALIAKNRTTLTESLFFDAGWRHEYVDYDQTRFNFDGSVQQMNRDTVSLNSYKLGLLYKALENLSLYYQFNSQHDSLNRALADYSYPSLSPFKAPTVEQNEIGLKTFFGEKKHELRFAAFDIIKKGITNNNGIIQTNERQARGFEFYGNWQTSENLKIGASATRTMAELVHYYDVNFDLEADGYTPINVPDTTAGLWLSYNNLFNKPLELILNYRYVSERYAVLDNSVIYNSYSLLNAGLAYTGKNYRLAMHARNSRDTLYVPFSEPFYPDQVILGSPRSLEFNFRYVFN